MPVKNECLGFLCNFLIYIIFAKTIMRYYIEEEDGSSISLDV